MTCVSVRGISSRERMTIAMQLGMPDRVPVMCQLALGHYFLNSSYGAVEIWHDTQAFGRALIELQLRYGFDGILVNLPGRDPEWRRQVETIEERGPEKVVRWRGGSYSVCPPDDNPHVYQGDGTRRFATLAEIDPDKLFYVEPHDLAGITYPQRWGFDCEAAVPGPDFFPPWHYDTLRYVREHAPEVSVHGEVFSPFSQFLELLGYTDGLLALRDDPGKVQACLERLAMGAIEFGRGLTRAGADAILMSSAFAGAGFISPRHYEQFVLPHERRVIDGIRRGVEHPPCLAKTGRDKGGAPSAINVSETVLPIYTHTCGAIGDRLELMAATGTNGIDTLDPPPLGTVDLAEAKRQLSGRLFLKGNLDAVNTMLRGSVDDVRAAARERIAIGAPGGGYILSSACSVAPHTPAANIAVLREVAEEMANGKWQRTMSPDE